VLALLLVLLWVGCPGLPAVSGGATDASLQSESDGGGITVDSGLIDDAGTINDAGNSNDAGASDSGNDGGRATTDGGSCTPEADRVCSCALGAPASLGPSRLLPSASATAPDGTRLLAFRLDYGQPLRVQVFRPNGSPVAPDVAVAGVQVDNVTWVGDQFAVFTGTEWTRVSTAGAILGTVPVTSFLTAAAVAPPDAMSPRAPKVRFVEGARRAALSVECRGWAAPLPFAFGASLNTCADNALLYWRVDGTLAPLGPPTRINAAGDNTLFAPSRAVETCSGIAVAFTTQTVAEPVPGLGRKLLQGWGLLVLDETHLINRSEVFSSIDALTLQGVVLGVGGRSLLACETHYLGGVAPYTSPSCREFDLSGAPLGGSFFVNDPRPPLNVRSGLNQVPVVVATPCGFSLFGTRTTNANVVVGGKELVTFTIHNGVSQETTATSDFQPIEVSSAGLLSLTDLPPAALAMRALSCGP
jgi:hypothetical protein